MVAYGIRAASHLLSLLLLSRLLTYAVLPLARWLVQRFHFGTMLAEMRQHQLTIRDYLRHSNLHVTNKYLQATSRSKRLAQDKLVDAILRTGLLTAPKLIQ